MALYEHVFLARQDVSSQQVEGLVEQYKGVIEANGGNVIAQVTAWLDEAAQKPEWLAYQADQAQGDLFK